MSASNGDASLPWRSIKASRRPDTPIKEGTNLLLVVTVVGLSVSLLWLASFLSQWYWTLGLGVVFSYLMLTNYALMHEAIHLNLQENQGRNYIFGVISSCMFPVSFTMVQITHQGHHYRNRTDAEIFDQYYPGRLSKFLKFGQWYGTLLGFFYFLVVLTSFLIGLIPGITRSRIFIGEVGNGNLADVTKEDLKKIRLEMAVLICGWAAIFYFLQLNWLIVLLMFGMAGINWSTRQYIGHAYSPREIIDGAWNLRHNPIMSRILLHGEWDLTHHKYPDVPWSYLPTMPIDGRDRPGYVGLYFRMWAGPRLVDEAEPDMWDTDEMRAHILNRDQD